jgi:DNA-binding transcriptional MerR regulator
MNAERMYGIAAFAALAGVTPRALRHYERLGLLKPRRSSSGYRRYSERDLETLEEIVALKFIGVPLKQIAAIRGRRDRPFLQVLRAQRETLDAKRRLLSRAVEAIASAEARLATGAGIDTDAIRQIIEVMHMEENYEQLIETYSAKLRAKLTHLSALSPQERVALKQEWGTLIEDVKGALGEDPAGEKAQGLLDRWESLRQASTGGAVKAGDVPPLPAPELRAALWSRRAEWLPEEVVRTTGHLRDADDALARARGLATASIGDDVLEFIRKARAARG